MAHLIEEAKGDAAARTRAELINEGAATVGDGAERADDDDNEAEAGAPGGREGAVLVPATLLGATHVRSEAECVGVGVEVAVGTNIKSLDVDEGVLVGSRLEDDVG